MGNQAAFRDTPEEFPETSSRGSARSELILVKEPSIPVVKEPSIPVVKESIGIYEAVSSTQNLHYSGRGFVLEDDPDDVELLGSDADSEDILEDLVTTGAATDPKIGAATDPKTGAATDPNKEIIPLHQNAVDADRGLISTSHVAPSRAPRSEALQACAHIY